MSLNSVNLIQVYGYHHSGTSILRKIIGNHPLIVDVEAEKAVAAARHGIQEANKEGMQGVVAKTITRGRIDLNVFNQFDFAVLTIRNPRDVIPSLLLRNPNADTNFLLNAWRTYAKDYLAFSDPRVRKVRYEDLFDTNWNTLRAIFEFLRLDWHDSCVLDNPSRRVPIHHPSVPDSEPDRLSHEAFRSWQINQKFSYMGGKHRHLLTPEVREILQSCRLAKELGYCW